MRHCSSGLPRVEGFGGREQVITLVHGEPLTVTLVDCADESPVAGAAIAVDDFDGDPDGGGRLVVTAGDPATDASGRIFVLRPHEK